MSGAVVGGALLDLLEPGWRRELAAGVPGGRLDVEPGVARAAAAALGEQSRRLTPGGAAGRWPACVIVAIARVAAGAGEKTRIGSFWAAWHRAAGLRQSRRSAGEWGDAFLAALGTLGLPAAWPTADDAVRGHAAAPGRENEADGERGDVAGEEGATAGLRLDPFGGGVLRVDTASGEARPLLPADAVPPADAARDGGRLLVFDTDGALAGRVLPAEAVWAVCPVNAELRSDVPLRTLVTSTLPLTWGGWRLVQLDLREASWLTLRDTAARADTEAPPHEAATQRPTPTQRPARTAGAASCAGGRSRCSARDCRSPA